MYHINLFYNNGFEWVINSRRTIYIKGYLFQGNKYLEGLEFINVLEKIRNRNEFRKLLETYNGQFSIIIIIENCCLVASDIIRSFPLFYMHKNNSIWISDSIDYLIKKFDQIELLKQSEEEFLTLGYVLGSNTLIKDIFQIQAGEMLFFKNKIIYKLFYFTYLTNEEYINKNIFLEKEFKNILHRVFSRLLSSCKGRQIVIPLSGGMDSRLIALYLKKLKAENVLCVTYGRKDNIEAKVSKKVAKRLGFKWYFIEYNDELIKDFLISDVFNDYYKYVAHYSSLFYFQEYFCVKYLKEHKIIDENAIAIPGFSGDMIGGSHLRKNIAYHKNFKFLARDIVLKEFIYQNHTQKQFDCFISKLSKSFPKGYYAYSIFENWNIKERQSKFIQNSALVWNYFGFEYRTPFWDMELVTFFQHLPYKYKLHKKFYTEVLQELFKTNELNVELDKPFSKRSVECQYWKKRIKYHFTFLEKLKSFQNIEDTNYYKEITQYLMDDALVKNEKIEKITDYNSVIIQWYLKKVQGKI